MPIPSERCAMFDIRKIFPRAKRTEKIVESRPPERSDAGQGVDDRVKKFLKYGVSYAETHPVYEPVGVLSQLVDTTFLSQEISDPQGEFFLDRNDVNWDDVIRRDKVPIPDTRNREDYFPERHLVYWLSGYVDYYKTLAAVKSYGISGGRFFDFGGSTGRVFRHFAFQSDKWDVWSSDFKISSVEWNMKYFPTSIKALLNNSNPSLPLPDNYFDLVTAFSVFTHINETETAWLLELRRILKIGGIAYLSIHDESTWCDQKDQLHDTDQLHDVVVRFRPDIAELEEMPKGKTVVTFREDDPYNCIVFHSREHIENVWGRFFEICEIRSSYHFYQGVVVCRRAY